MLFYKVHQDPRNRTVKVNFFDEDTNELATS